MITRKYEFVDEAAVNESIDLLRDNKATSRNRWLS